MLTITQDSTVQEVPGVMSRRRFATALGIILVAGVALRLWLLFRGLPVLDSDEATYGLMALHLRHGEWSVFLWGQNYMGSLEAMLLGPILWLFGPSAITLRLVPLGLSVGFMISSALLANWLISRRAGLLAAALVAIGSPFFTILSMRAFGGYAETLFFGNLILWGALRGDRSPRALGLLGLCIGVAIWTDFLVLPFVAAAGAIWWWQRRRDLLGRNGIILGGALFVGVLPAIIYNILNAGATVTTISGLSVAGGTQSAAVAPTQLQIVGALLLQPWNELTISLPILAGTWFGGTQSNGLHIPGYQAAIDQYPIVYAIALGIALGTLALLVSLAVPIVRNWRALSLPLPENGAQRRHILRRQYEAAIVILVAGYMLAFALQRQGLWAIPRYLLPLFVAVPVLVGQLERLGLAVAARWPRFFSPAIASALPLIICLPILAWNLGNCLQLTPLQTAALDHDIWITQDNRPIIALLRAHGVHTVISNDYWEGLRLTFESGEQVIVVMVTPEGHPGFNRYLPYIATGLSDPHPAYMELVGTGEAQALQQRFTTGQLPGYTLHTVGQFVIAVPGTAAS